MELNWYFELSELSIGWAYSLRGNGYFRSHEHLYIYNLVSQEGKDENKRIGYFGFSLIL